MSTSIFTLKIVMPSGSSNTNLGSLSFSSLCCFSLLNRGLRLLQSNTFSYNTTINWFVFSAVQLWYDLWDLMVSWIHCEEHHHIPPLQDSLSVFYSFARNILLLSAVFAQCFWTIHNSCSYFLPSVWLVIVDVSACNNPTTKQADIETK